MSRASGCCNWSSSSSSSSRVASLDAVDSLPLAGNLALTYSPWYYAKAHAFYSHHLHREAGGRGGCLGYHDTFSARVWERPPLYATDLPVARPASFRVHSISTSLFASDSGFLWEFPWRLNASASTPAPRCTVTRVSGASGPGPQQQGGP